MTTLNIEKKIADAEYLSGQSFIELTKDVAFGKVVTAVDAFTSQQLAEIMTTHYMAGTMSLLQPEQFAGVPFEKLRLVFHHCDTFTLKRLRDAFPTDQITVALNKIDSSELQQLFIDNNFDSLANRFVEVNSK